MKYYLKNYFVLNVYTEYVYKPRIGCLLMWWQKKVISGFKVFGYSFFGDHTSLFESALRQSSPCQINVKFPRLVGFRLNFKVVYIL